VTQDATAERGGVGVAALRDWLTAGQA